MSSVMIVSMNCVSVNVEMTEYEFNDGDSTNDSGEQGLKTNKPQSNAKIFSHRTVPYL